MKKTYTKPEIMFESFSFSTNIAGDCGILYGVSAENVCGLDFGGDMIFVDGVQGCQMTLIPDDGTSGVCYHNPYDTIRLFTSG